MRGCAGVVSRVCPCCPRLKSGRSPPLGSGSQNISTAGSKMIAGSLSGNFEPKRSKRDAVALRNVLYTQRRIRNSQSSRVNTATGAAGAASVPHLRPIGQHRACAVPAAVSRGRSRRLGRLGNGRRSHQDAAAPSLLRTVGSGVGLRARGSQRLCDRSPAHSVR